jgi:hypothetical protein
MNKIYIINYLNDYEIDLNFKTNTFSYNDISYKFDIPSNDKIIIYNNENENKEIYYTEDSYLYYIDLQLKNKIKKFFLIHNEWFDQIIVNFEKNIIKRINHNNEIANFIYDYEKLVIIWNYWGKEIFIKHDNYTYIKDEYIKNKLQISNEIISNNIPIHIFIHICMIENWETIFNDQINTIKKSGLYDICEKIHIGLLGNINNFNNIIFNDEKFNILYIDSRINLYEINTINFIKYFCLNIEYEIYILYIHTKGVRKAGNENVTTSWRKMMEYFLIENYQHCINNLHNYDTIGNNIVNMYCVNMNEICVNKNHTYHYSGNFWWSKKSYIDKLTFLNIDLSKSNINTRYVAENWILSQYPSASIGYIFQDDTNTHPYHRYVFDYYKDINIIIKKLL